MVAFRVSPSDLDFFLNNPGLAKNRLVFSRDDIQRIITEWLALRQVDASGGFWLWYNQPQDASGAPSGLQCAIITKSGDA